MCFAPDKRSEAGKAVAVQRSLHVMHLIKRLYIFTK